VSFDENEKDTPSTVGFPNAKKFPSAKSSDDGREKALLSASRPKASVLGSYFHQLKIRLNL
jgi:hypothetical protein